MTRLGRRRGGLLAAAGLIGAATLAARVVGFGRWLVFSDSVGAGCVGEAYSTANVLPNVLFEVAAGGALAAVVVPLVAGALGRGDSQAADRAASALLGWALVVLLPLSLLLAAAAGPVVDLLYADDACPGGRDLAAGMLVVFAPQVTLYGVGIVLGGVLQAHRRFLAAAVAPLLSSVVVIGSYVLYAVLAGSATGTASARPSSATAVLAVGTTLGVVALSLPLLVPVRRAGVRLRPTLTFPPGLARSARGLAGAGILALAAQQLAVVVSFAVLHAHGSPGTVNVYQYVQAVYLLPYAVLAVPVATAAFPALAAGVAGASTPAAGDERRGPAATLAAALRAVLLAGCAGAALLAATAGPAGAFFAALDATGGDPGGPLGSMGPALLAFATGLAGFGAAAVLTRALYARGRPLVAAAWVAAGWVVAGVLPLLVLSGSGTDTGRALVTLGLASSAGMWLTAAGQLIAVHRAWGRGALGGAARTGLAGGAGAVAGAASGAGAAFVVARGFGAAPGGPLGSAVADPSLTGSLASGAAASVAAVAAFAAVAALLDRSALAGVAHRVRRRPVADAESAS